jgi:hypothetical protein
MSILLAGGMVIAAPSMVPVGAAAGALYVSAENAMFTNLFAGAMVLEIIVKDPARADTDESEGEPTVLVDNMRLGWLKVMTETGTVTLQILIQYQHTKPHKVQMTSLTLVPPTLLVVLVKLT